MSSVYPATVITPASGCSVTGGGFIMSNLPRSVYISTSTSQSISNLTGNTLIASTYWPTASSNNNFAIGTNSTFTIPSAGLYVLQFQCNFSASSQLWWNINNGDYYGCIVAGPTILSSTYVGYLTAGTTVSPRIYSTTSGASATFLQGQAYISVYCVSK